MVHFAVVTTVTYYTCYMTATKTSGYRFLSAREEHRGATLIIRGGPADELFLHRNVLLFPTLCLT